MLFRNETGASAAEKRARTTARKKAAATLRGHQAGRAIQQTAEQSGHGGSVTSPAHIAASRARSTDNDSLDDSLTKVSFRYVASRGRHGSGSGYRNEFGSSHGGNTSDSSSSYSSGSSRYYYGSIVPALPVPPDQLAVCHFFSNFVLVPFQGTGRGYMDFLVPLMKTAESPTSLYASVGTKEVATLRGGADGAGSTPGTGSSPNTEARAALSIAFRACALASMGTRVASNGFAFADKALSAYTRALAATHLALRDPTLSRADNTLGAVLLLSLFEVSTPTSSFPPSFSVYILICAEHHCQAHGPLRMGLPY